MAITTQEFYIDWSEARSLKEEQLAQHRAQTETVADSNIETLDKTQRLDLYGACLGTNADTFFPEKGESLKPAQEICARCVVKEECLEYALENGEGHGVWGGSSERERRRIRRARRAASLALAQEADQ